MPVVRRFAGNAILCPVVFAVSKIHIVTVIRFERPATILSIARSRARSRACRRACRSSKCEESQSENVGNFSTDFRLENLDGKFQEIFGLRYRDSRTSRVSWL